MLIAILNLFALDVMSEIIIGVIVGTSLGYVMTSSTYRELEELSGI